MMIDIYKEVRTNDDKFYTNFGGWNAAEDNIDVNLLLSFLLILVLYTCIYYLHVYLDNFAY